MDLKQTNQAHRYTEWLVDVRGGQGLGGGEGEGKRWEKQVNGVKGLRKEI